MVNSYQRYEVQQCTVEPNEIAAEYTGGCVALFFSLLSAFDDFWGGGLCIGFSADGDAATVRDPGIIGAPFVFLAWQAYHTPCAGFICVCVCVQKWKK